MSTFLLAQIGTTGALAALVVTQGRGGLLSRWRASERVLGVYAVVQLGFLAVLWLNHWRFPLHLDLMEGAVWQHVQRAVQGLAVYPPPTPEYVPLAYNPLYYSVASVAVRVFGDGLPVLRLVAAVGAVAAIAAVYVAVRDGTGSKWWGLVGVGLFCGAYRAMDAYLDTAHADSWLVALALWGTLLLRPAHGRGVHLLGVALLVGSFWFKQHGALFAMGGATWLTWRYGIREASGAWALILVGGALAYLFAGPSLFGPSFHYFTWSVPSGWSQPSLAGLARAAGYLIRWYPVLLLAAALVPISRRWNGPATESAPWTVQFAAAIATALMGSMDPDSSNNVFIPAGAFAIVCGTIALHQQAQAWRERMPVRIGLLGLALSVGALLYDPRSVLLPRDAQGDYADLVATLRALPGAVYAPYQAYLGPEVPLHPHAHWVALEDMLRGPGHGASDSAAARKLLAPALEPDGEAWILANFELRRLPRPVRELAPHYVLAHDFGDRWITLRGLPRRFDHGFPRYLYRHVR